MCEDRPSRRVLFDLLGALYRNHPVKIDIAGTVESIAQITPELLYDCYRAFYDLRNMVLVVTGNVTPEQVLAVADRALRPAGEGGAPAAREPVGEPDGVAAARMEAVMPVAAPLFYLGYKDTWPADRGAAACPPQAVAASYVLLDVLAGKASPLYTRLMEQELINETFDAEYFHGPGYGAWLFGGESRDPDAIAAAVRAEIARLRREGIDPEAFRAARSALYGRLIAGLNDVENGGDTLVDDYFSDRNPFALLDAAAGLDIQSVEDRLAASLSDENAALSIVRPA